MTDPSDPPKRRRQSASKRAAGKKAPAATPERDYSRHPMDVRWRDLDAFNHVNNATFLTYLEEARLQWLESLDGEWLTHTSAPVHYPDSPHRVGKRCRCPVFRRSGGDGVG